MKLSFSTRGWPNLSFEEMLEAAQIDGCSDFQYFLRMVLPLSGSVMAVITLYYAVGHWNAYVRYSATDRGKAYKSLYIHI